MRTRMLSLVALVGMMLSFSRVARAEGPGDLALDQLDPAPAGDAFFGVPSPFVGGHLAPRASLVFGYAHQPLVVSDGVNEAAVVGQQGILHVGASLGLWDRLVVSALMPVVLLQAGESPTIRGVDFASPSLPALGDLRLGARIRVFGEEGDPLQIAGGANFYVPTGTTGVYAGEGALRVAPQVVLGGRTRYLVWSAMVSAMIRGSHNPSSLVYGGGVALSVLEGKLQLGPEIYASTPLQNGFVEVGTQRSIEREVVTNAELLLGIKVRPGSGMLIGLAGGPGLSDAWGTPVFRAIGMLGWAPEAASSAKKSKDQDRDEDGVVDERDACPYAFGDKSEDPTKNGCPPPAE